MLPDVPYACQGIKAGRISSPGSSPFKAWLCNFDILPVPVFHSKLPVWDKPLILLINSSGYVVVYITRRFSSWGVSPGQ